MSTLLITGSRCISKAGLAYARRTVARAKELSYEVIVGDASGVDEAVIQECHRLGVTCTVVGAYGRLRRRTPSCKVIIGRGSYIQRDRYMAEQCSVCLAVWNGKSRGTKATHDFAVELGKTAWLKTFHSEDSRGERPAHAGGSKVKTVTMYTDGACSGNPGPGGWCAILQWGNHERIVKGGVPATTNNRMELTAIIEGLAALKEPCKVMVFTDSQYAIGVMTIGWKRKANHDLLDRLDALCVMHKVEFQYIRGHDGHPENERCDRIACQERDAARERPRRLAALRGLGRPGSRYEPEEIEAHRLASGFEQVYDQIYDMAP